MVDDPPNNAVALQLPELLYQHLLRDRQYRSLKIGKTNHFPPEKMEQNYQFPAALQKLESLLNTAGATLAAVIGVCLFSLLEGEYLTFLWVLAIS